VRSRRLLRRSLVPRTAGENRRSARRAQALPAL